MTPELDRAAIAATQMLIENAVGTTPINPLAFLLNYPGVRVISFSQMANEADKARDGLVPLFCENQDAATFHLNIGIEHIEYIVVYNMRLSADVVNRGLARELGHIVLGHDGSTRPYDVRRAEAMCFAHHLMSPRPVLRILQESGFPLTLNVLSDTVSCIDECVEDMRRIPGAHVPPEMNRQVKTLFARSINEYVRFHCASHRQDRSPLVDLGTFMDGYEE